MSAIWSLSGAKRDLNTPQNGAGAARAFGEIFLEALTRNSKKISEGCLYGRGYFQRGSSGPIKGGNDPAPGRVGWSSLGRS